MSQEAEQSKQMGGTELKSTDSPTKKYLSVTYTVTEQDLYERYRQFNLSDPTRRARLWLGFAVLLVGMFWAFSSTLPLPQLLLLEGVIAVLAFPLYHWLLRSRVRDYIRDVPVAVGESTTAIFPEGLREFSDAGEVQFKWADIIQVETIPEYILICLDPSFTQIIPRRAFPSPEAADEFFRAAKTWHAESHRTATGR
jgi:hypothetical protein